MTQLFVAFIAPVSVLCALLPGAAGKLLLGVSWESARPLIPLLAIESVLAVISLAAFAGHRVEQAGLRTLVIGLVIGIVRVAALATAGQTFGAGGAAYALILVALLSTVAWWASYVLLLRREPVTYVKASNGPQR